MRTSVNLLILCSIVFFTGCAAMPQLFQAVDDIATDDCVTIKVDRDAFKNENGTDVHLQLDVVNKDPENKN